MIFLKIENLAVKRNSLAAGDGSILIAHCEYKGN